jgi:hypothetical protein
MSAKIRSGGALIVAEREEQNGHGDRDCPDHGPPGAMLDS